MYLIKEKKKERSRCQLYTSGSLIIAMTAAIVLWLLLKDNEQLISEEVTCNPNKCSMMLAESIPENLTYPSGSPHHESVYNVWKTLLQRAETSIDIASSYWSLRGNDTDVHDPSTALGEDIYRDLLDAGTKRGIKIRIAQSLPSKSQPGYDTIDLVAAGAAEVRSLDFPRWFHAGILHTKMWLVDGKHFYVGSANLDWRSLTQVKEMSIGVFDCDCLAQDMSKIFEVYWQMGGSKSSKPPTDWPIALQTKSNIENPMTLIANTLPTSAYLASSPPGLCPKGRSSDIDAILNVMKNAKKYIYIAVMDYFPMSLYTWPQKFWPVLDDAIREAALDHRIEIRLMASWWKHSRPQLVNHLKSLIALNGVNKARISAKLFKVPSFTKAQSLIPFARVNHNKYMITDKQAYIGTSNWSEDYFISTGGIGMVFNQTVTSGNHTSIQNDLYNVFIRDWDSEYAESV